MLPAARARLSLSTRLARRARVGYTSPSYGSNLSPPPRSPPLLFFFISTLPLLPFASCPLPARCPRLLRAPLILHDADQPDRAQDGPGGAASLTTGQIATSSQMRAHLSAPALTLTTVHPLFVNDLCCCARVYRSPRGWPGRERVSYPSHI